ncbi:MAG: GAF domain-containing protein [Anaerolineae bacterium]
MIKLYNLIASSIRNKLIAVVGLATSLSILMGGVYTITAISRTLQDRTTINELAALDSAASAIDSFLAGVEQDALYLSRAQPLRQYLAAVANPRSDTFVENQRLLLEQDLLAFARAHKVYDQVRFIDASGQEVARINTDAGGVSAIVPQDELQNKAQRYYFTEAMELSLGEVYVSPLDLNVEHGAVEVLPDGSYKPTIRYGTPVVYNGRPVGVIVINVLAKNFLEPLGQQKGEVYLVDGDGYYLFHPDRSKRWGRDLQTGVTLFSDYAAEPAQALLSPNNGTFIRAGNFFAHQPVRITGHPEINWYIGKTQPITTLLAPLINFVYGASAVTLALIIVAVVGATLLGRTITGPIVALKQAAEQVAGGDFGVEVAKTTRDEIGSLAVSFNAMANQVRELVTTLEDRVQERTRALETSAIISRQFTTILDIDELLSQVVNSIQNAFKYDHVHMYLVDEPTGDLVLHEGAGRTGRRLVNQGYRLKPGEGVVGAVARSGKAVLATGGDEISAENRSPLLSKTRAELAVPLRKGETILGILDVRNEAENSLDEEDQTLVQAIADQVAVAVDNAHLFQETRRAVAEVEAMNRRLTRQVWHGITDKTGTHGFVFTKSGATVAASEWLPVMNRAVQQKELARQNGEREDAPGGESSLAIPLLLRGEVIGAIGIERPAERAWTDDELTTIRAISEQISLALDAARLADETERAAWRDRVVGESTAEIWATAEVEQVMKAAVSQLGQKLRASEVIIRLGKKVD